MILIAVGREQPFERLIDVADRWASRHPQEPVFAQIGAGARRPRHIDWAEELRPNEFEALLRAADLVVCHAGMGVALSARRLGKPLVVVPRDSALGEHYNDEQVATARAFEACGVGRVAWTEADLLHALGAPREISPPPLEAEGAHSKLLRTLHQIINEVPA